MPCAAAAAEEAMLEGAHQSEMCTNLAPLVVPRSAAGTKPPLMNAVVRTPPSQGSCFCAQVSAVRTSSPFCAVEVREREGEIGARGRARGGCCPALQHHRCPDATKSSLRLLNHRSTVDRSKDWKGRAQDGSSQRERGRAHGAEDEERVLPHLRLRQRRAHIRQPRVQHVQHVRVYIDPRPALVSRCHRSVNIVMAS